MSDWYDVPELVGEHVRLVPLEPEHAAGILAASDDDEVFRWQAFARPESLDDAKGLIDFYFGRPNAITWAQFDQSSDELAGLTTYYDIDPVRRTVAIGATWLGRRFWRSGVNTEAKLLLLGRAFDDLGCVREGVLRKHLQRRDGSWRDTVLFSMTDDEWPAARERLMARQGQ